MLLQPNRFLLQYDHHQQTQDYVKALNKFYTANNALWSKDFDSFGFEWIEADDKERSFYAYIRRGSRKEDTLVILCNFTPNTYEEFRVGVPFEGTWKEVFNSDATAFGGSGVVNDRPAKSEPIEWNRRENSIALRLAPLSVVIYSPE